MRPFSSELLASVFELVGHSGISVGDFRRLIGLRRDFGFGVQDHQRACHFLVQEGFLVDDGFRITLGLITEQDWLVKGLADGDGHLFALTELIPRRNWKFDPDELSATALGSEGEHYVLERLHSSVDTDLTDRIVHVASYNDAAGFDIKSPSCADSSRDVFLEVKTSARPSENFVFYITRNEADVASQVDSWFLVGVQKSPSGLDLVGHLRFSEIGGFLPVDRGATMKWKIAYAEIDRHEFRPGLP